MPKGKTISTRWSEWAKTPGEFYWSYTALTSFITRILGLGLHLWILDGFWRTFGLAVLIGCAIVTQSILFFRARRVPTVWWWFWFHAYVVAGVIGFEISSYVWSMITGK